MGIDAMFFSDFSFVIPPSHRTPLSFQICRRRRVFSQDTRFLSVLIRNCDEVNARPARTVESRSWMKLAIKMWTDTAHRVPTAM